MSTYNDTRINLQAVKFTTDAAGVSTPTIDDSTGEAVVEVSTNITEKKANTTIAEFKTKGLPEPEITKIQTFQYTKVGETDPTGDLITLLSSYNPDEAQVVEVAASIINRGLVLAQQNYGRDFMNDADQAGVEGVYDLMTDTCKPGEGRRKADPASKAVKALSELLGQNITADDLAALLASFKQSAAV